jgi:hypothetical protein
VKFELDSNVVVEKFHSSKIDDTELGDIMSHCKRLFSTYYNNSSFEFVRRQKNEVAHRLAKTTSCIASLQIMVEILYCVEHTLINDMI